MVKSIPMSRNIHFPEVDGVKIPMATLVKFTAGQAFSSSYDDANTVQLSSELASFRDRMVQAHREVNPQAQLTNQLAVALTEIALDERSIEATFQPVQYFDTWGVHTHLDVNMGDGRTPRQTYGDLEDMMAVGRFNSSPYPKQVGCSLVVVGKDNRTILQRRSNRVAIVANMMHVAIAEGMKETDRDDQGKLTPVRTAKRAVYQELTDPAAPEHKRVTILDEAVQILAIGISRQFLQPEFAALWKSEDLTAQEIADMGRNSRGKWERVELVIADFTEQEIGRLLRVSQFSPHASYALAMALATEKE